jgi:hypothetical protein
MNRLLIGMLTLLFTSHPLLAEDDGVLEGEIFIVTAGAENIRFGLVEVKILPEAAIESYLEKRKTRVKEEMPDFEKLFNSPYMQKVDAEDDAFIAKERAGIVELETTVQEMKTLTAQAEDIDKAAGRRSDRTMRSDISVFEGFIATHEKLIGERLKSKEKRAKATQARIREARENWPTPNFWLEALPEPKCSARTNSDGKFRFFLPKTGRFALAAQATRKVGDNYEYYSWFIWVSLEGKESKGIILGNHNLMSRGSKESVISTKSDS